MTSLDAVRNKVPLRTRHRFAKARVRSRVPTSRWRRVPDFLVIGAQRCGTSSLFRYLRGHPQIAASVRKEVEYFSRYHHHGERWYRAHFPLDTGGGRSVRTFEATPDYLFHPLAPERVARLLPDARFVVLLRDATARAISHHQHMTRLGIETLNLADALDAEPVRTGPDLERLAHDAGHDARALLRYSYLARGQYAEQLARWFSMFEQDRFLVLASEDLYRRPAEVFDEVQEFLELDRWSPGWFPNHSATADARPELDPVVRSRIIEHFEPHNAALVQLLGWCPEPKVTS